MTPCHVVEIVTPKKYVLNGLWFGPRKPKQAVIFIHGLGGSVFSMKNVVGALVGAHTAVLAFNNRGFGQINTVKRKSARGTKPVVAGAGHEIFTDSVDDVQGAVNFVRRQGIREVYVAGHSTGCQKAILWTNREGKGVRGVILLAPVSDWAAEMMLQGKKRIEETVAAARALVRLGRKHDLLPRGKVTKRHETFDAQRILSLYTPDSTEEMFTYAQPKKVSRLYRSVKLPVLAVFAGKDEYGDRPARDISTWFEKEARSRDFRSIIVKGARHGFKGKEAMVARAIRGFIKKTLR